MKTETAYKSSQPSIGKLLQYWRNLRRKSQLDLALDAEISQRHLSFLESGRSQPSRKMIITLADALEIPLRERNDLLQAAGFARLYRESDWNDAALAPVRRALDSILENQEPFPAVVMDRHWNILMTNRAAPKFFGLFIDLAASPARGNVLRMMFHPAGIRPFVANWETVAKSLIQRTHRESIGGFQDAGSQALLDEIFSYRGVPRDWRVLDPQMATLPVVPVEFRRKKLRFDFFSAVTTLGTPQDIALQEVRIECFFPTDRKTENAARRFLSN